MFILVVAQRQLGHLPVCLDDRISRRVGVGRLLAHVVVWSRQQQAAVDIGQQRHVLQGADLLFFVELQLIGRHAIALVDGFGEMIGLFG